MFRKLLRSVLCVGMVCAMMVSTVLAEPPVEPRDYDGGQVITPFDICDRDKRTN